MRRPGQGSAWRKPLPASMIGASSTRAQPGPDPPLQSGSTPHMVRMGVGEENVLHIARRVADPPDSVRDLAGAAREAGVDAGDSFRSLQR